ncbi:MAG: family 10 glycosylhydrolase, partial [Candidatus Marinimicrobia bacterium]|nr:family 10 glycosylhydrolase [Candidatus Neomarinimicrobiota bacterium]
PKNSVDLEGVYNEVWRNYRRNSITDFVRSVHDMIQTDEIEISAAVKPDIRRATDYFLQDWPEWIEKGYLDFAVPMNYTPEMSTFQDNSIAIIKNVSKTSVVMGIGAYNQTEHSVSQKVQYALENRFKGVCIFSYDSLIEDPSYMALLKPYFRFAD